MELTFDARVTIEGKPFIAVLIDTEQVGQLDPGEAMSLGLRVIQSGIEAERDAGFLNFMLELDDSEDGFRAAATMLDGLRKHRAQFDTQAPIYPNDPRVEGDDAP